MKNPIRRALLIVAVGNLCTAFAQAPVAPVTALADKPIRIIVPFAPGGTTDIVTRIVAPALSKELKIPVIVDNRAGAGGIVGTNELAKAAPDGYTLGIATASSMATNPAINSKMPYNPTTDFTPIVNIAATPNIIAVHPSFPAKNYKEFLAALKANPGKYSYASSGVGGVGHMQMELFKNLSNTFVTHIPYRGAGPALLDVVGGQLPIIFDNLPSTLKYVTAGSMVPIVVSSPKRLPSLPDVPTFAEVGLTPVNKMAFYGLIGPKNMKPAMVEQIHAAVMKVLADPVVRKRIEDTSSQVVGNTPAEFKKQLRDEFYSYVTVVNSAKLKMD